MGMYIVWKYCYNPVIFHVQLHFIQYNIKNYGDMK